MSSQIIPISEFLWWHREDHAVIELVDFEKIRRTTSGGLEKPIIIDFVLDTEHQWNYTSVDSREVVSESPAEF